jgi:hypothetical protein
MSCGDVQHYVMCTADSVGYHQVPLNGCHGADQVLLQGHGRCWDVHRCMQASVVSIALPRHRHVSSGAEHQACLATATYHVEVANARLIQVARVQQHWRSAAPLARCPPAGPGQLRMKLPRGEVGGAAGKRVCPVASTGPQRDQLLREPSDVLMGCVLLLPSTTNFGCAACCASMHVGLQPGIDVVPGRTCVVCYDHCGQYGRAMSKAV